MTVNDLLPGQSGYVIRLGGGGVLRRRLIDMGVTPGVTVTVVRTAPLGDPIELTLRGYQLSIRREEAARIQIEENRP